MTIGLYDADFLHGPSFSLSLPLMKAYNRFYKEGHQVIMLKSFKDEGRCNKIFVFKESPKLNLPKSVNFNDKCSYHGYGFFGKNNISEKTKKYAPSFMPYDLMSHKIKSKTKYNKIISNGIIDWREKDFTGYHENKIAFVNDRDFMKEEDWEEVFQRFDAVNFVHSICPQTFEDAKKFLKLSHDTSVQVMLPEFTLEEEYIRFFGQYRNVCFSADSLEKQIATILAAKVLGDNSVVVNSYFNLTPFEKDIDRWSRNGGQISFKEFMGDKWDDRSILKFSDKIRFALKLNPAKISYERLKNEVLTF